MASEISKIRAPDAFTGAQRVATVGRIVACGALAPFCAAQYLGEQAGIRAGEYAYNAGSGAVDGFGDALSETRAGLVGDANSLLDHAVNPLRQAADISTWVAVGIIAFSAMVIVVVLVAAWKF